MPKRLEVYVDIYKDYFNEPDNQQFVYTNIVAVNPIEQESVNNIITQMKNSNSSLLLDEEMIMFSEMKPIETSVKCILNTELLRFEFK